MTHNVLFENIRAGQAKAYADSVYEYILTFTELGTFGRWEPDREQVMKYVKVYHNSCHFVEDKSKKQWHEAWLETFEKIDKNKWRVVIIDPYLD